MSYFHTGTRTIIGAEAFHCPVRDGKEWDHLAMVIRHNLSPARALGAGPTNSQSRATITDDVVSGDRSAEDDCTTRRSTVGFARPERRTLLAIRSVLAVRAEHQGYRVKPHGQLVLVSLTHYCASTPSLSTSWSRTTLQGAQGPGKTHLGTSFPLRCFQRLSLPHLATRQCHWRDNRYTRGASTPVLSY